MKPQPSSKVVAPTNPATTVKAADEPTTYVKTSREGHGPNRPSLSPAIPLEWIAGPKARPIKPNKQRLISNELDERRNLPPGRPERYSPARTPQRFDVQMNKAVKICRNCPVVDRCRDYAITLAKREPIHGVWGGLRPSEINKLVRGRVQVSGSLLELRHLPAENQRGRVQQL